jgi:hypothetical protein
MKRFLTILVLISHINYAMFIPQLDEVDVYDADGKQQDDINSLVEYIDQVLLGHKSNAPADEDDDTGFFLNIVKIDPYTFEQFATVLTVPVYTLREKANYLPYKDTKLSSIYFDIQSPPPEA